MLGCQIKITFKLRKTKYKEGGPQRGLVELYCQSNDLNGMIYNLWNVCTTLCPLMLGMTQVIFQGSNFGFFCYLWGPTIWHTSRGCIWGLRVGPKENTSTITRKDVGYLSATEGCPGPFHRIHTSWASNVELSVFLLNALLVKQGKWH